MFKNNSNVKMNYQNNIHDEHIYYDLKINNTLNHATPNEEYKKFIVKDESSTILKKQSDYHIAIHSFMLNVDIPLIVMPIQEGITQSDINLTIYSFTLSHNNIDYQETIRFTPEIDMTLNRLDTPLSPSQNSGLQDFSTGYYYIYSYYSWCKMFNDAFDLINTRINTDTPNLFPNGGVKLVYENEQFLLVYPKEIYSTNTQIFCNEITSLTFGGFPTRLIKFNNINGKTNQIIIPPLSDPMTFVYHNPNDNTPAHLPDFYKITQEYDARFRLNGVSQIILTSDFLSVRKEFYPDINNPNNVSITSNYQTFNTPSLPIIASFSMIDYGGSSWVETQHYQPAFYKWLDLIGDNPLKEIDVKVFLQLKSGGLVQAFIPTESASIIKFIFKKKTSLDSF